MADEKFFNVQPLDRENDAHFSTPNYLSPVSFRVVVPRLPKFTYFVQSVSIPSVVMGSVEIPAFKGLPKQEVPSFLDITDQLIINFNIDENMENWQEVYDWMTSIVPSKENNATVDPKNELLWENIIVLVYNNAKKLIKKFTFHKCYPVNLGSFEFNSAMTTTDPLLVTVNFEYSHFTVETL